MKFDLACVAVGLGLIAFGTLIFDALYWPGLIAVSAGGGFIGSPVGRRLGEFLYRAFFR